MTDKTAKTAEPQVEAKPLDPQLILGAYADIRDVDQVQLPTQLERREKAVKLLEEFDLEYTGTPHNSVGTGHEVKDSHGSYTVFPPGTCAKPAKRGDFVRARETVGHFLEGGVYMVHNGLDSDGDLQVLNHTQNNGYVKATYFDLVMTVQRKA